LKLTTEPSGGMFWIQAESAKASMVFHILTPYKIDAYEHQLSDFIADDLLSAIESAETKIATSDAHLCVLQKAYPNYIKYTVRVERSHE